MKLKKLLISASSIIVGSSLFATVLTSCSKSNVDDDLKIDLDDNGNFIKYEWLQDGGIDYKQALKNALGRSTGWDQFKSALASEIVYQWYRNRAASDDHKEYNKEFKNNLKDWEYNIKKDYNNIVDDCKSKYGANWKFYLQNEHLAQNGGTEEAYKHTKLVEKVKADFIDRVFTTNYFGMRNSNDHPEYPIFYEDALMTPTYEAIKDPTNWKKLGFYAKVNNAYLPPKTVTADYLAQHPDGEYATIQDYVFNRWFDTEKPFFSAAALFEYSLPAQSGGKLENIYNNDWATLPEKPNEAFPFFGAIINSNDGKGTKAFYEWYQALLNGEFEFDGLYDDRTKYNGTITMSKDFTNDSQTLLLCSANDMFSSLYTPYAIAASKLYTQMMTANPTTSLNTMTQDELAGKVGETSPTDNDDFRLLSCFFYDAEEKMPGWVEETGTSTFTNYLDLNEIYGNTPGYGDEFHSQIFTQNDTYPYLFGDLHKPEGQRNGIRYITNNFEVKLGKNNPAYDPELEEPKYINEQPWILEMNEAGVHAQTIDGYQYVKKDCIDKKEALKEVVKFRLIEHKCYDESGLISADLFGTDDKSKLKSYFKDNFANIILEIAMINPDSTDKGKEGYYNIFRNVEDLIPTPPNATLLFNKVVGDEKLCENLDLIKEYINATIDVDRRQKVLSSIETVDSKIYEYRKTQIENSKSDHGKKRFENGLLAPMTVRSEGEESYKKYGTSHHYAECALAVILNDKYGYNGSNPIDRDFVYNKALSVLGTSFITDLGNVGVDKGDSAYSPQIKKAKDAESNRFWYYSWIVDKVMYNSMSKSTLANAIKQETYKKYQHDILSGDSQPTIEKIIGFNPENIRDVDGQYMNDGLKASYIANKMLSGTNFAAYTDNPEETDFYGLMLKSYQNKITNSYKLDGDYNDDSLNYWLFISTIAYLVKDDFAKFYDSLATKIHENELAYIAYVSQYNEDHPEQYPGVENPTEPMNLWKKGDEEPKYLPYDWTANVDNMFDRLGYSGKGKHGESYKQSFDQYWHVVNKGNMFGKTRLLSGFMGIQSASSNQFDEASGLKKAATQNFETSTYLSPNDQEFHETLEKGNRHTQNEGVLFPWANNKTEGFKERYKFDDVINPRDPETKINIDDFSGIPAAAKLAYNIASCSTIDDLKSIASSLSDAIYGASIFSQIAQGEIQLDPTDPISDLKYMMLNEFVAPGEEHIEKYKPYFNRLKNVELHTDVAIGEKYSFRNTQTHDCYKAMVTQINKSDLVDKLITPKWNGLTWDFSNCPITEQEFWYIFFDAAADPTNQQSAIADAVKTIFGDDKLVVYDAQLYNQFDSTWIKDWKKKPMGD